MLSHSKGLLNRKAVRMPESGSGQSFICRASICAATTAVGGSMGVGALRSSGLLLPLSLMCCENSDAKVVPACNALFVVRHVCKGGLSELTYVEYQYTLGYKRRSVCLTCTPLFFLTAAQA